MGSGCRVPEEEKVMETDIEIVKQLEKEIGAKIKRLKSVRVDEFECPRSYIADKDGHVIKLNLRYSHLKDIPKSILKLKNLITLYLSDNSISQLTSEITQLTKLRRLGLGCNSLTSIPKEITNLDMEISSNWYGGDGILLGDNPLKSPPIEIVNKGRKAVIEYFKSLEEGEELPLSEVKVLLVGDGGAGKTCLVKRLLGEKFDKNESQTHGISIKDWDIQENGKSINVHFWDFGGQDIMHATHQFFLSKRSLYVLVLDGRKEEDAEYWLKHIESFGGNSPILVVLNKMDENPGFDVNRRFLQDKYKGIKGFYRVSCANKSGIDGFSKRLNQELAKVEILETTWAKSWFNVKEQLGEMTDNFISYDQYKEICENENITEKDSQDTLVDFLNDIGVILHFGDFKLLDTHVLEPKWVTQAVYKIINSEELADNKGILKLSSLDKMLKKKRKGDYIYRRDKFPYIIELMKKFELCYEIDSQTALIPDLLEVQEPEVDFDYANCLRFLIEYDFLPKSITPRFIVKMHKDIRGQMRWRTGVVLEDKDFDSTAVIKADERDKKIFIYVNGVLRRDYFSVIRHAFLSINNGFEKLQFVEKVPMPDDPSITISYNHLKKLEAMGEEECIPDGAERKYRVKDLLGTVYIEKKTDEAILRLLRKIKSETDDQESLAKKANEIIQLQPNFFGLGVNFNKIITLIGRLFKKKSK